MAPTDVVRSFFSDVGELGPRAAFERWLADDVLWTNCGQPDCHGVAACVALDATSGAALGYERWTAELRAIAADGDVVLTDRIDRLVRPDGSVITDIEVMGSLKVVDDKITEWREYFDGPAIRQRLGL